MPAPSVTHTFTNGTTADATQVNQNFTDIINGVSDGTKDLSISALTVAGTATLNGAVTLGNATGDDVTITGSLASTIPIKTTNSFNIGSATLGLASVYLGSSAGAFTTRLLGAAVSSSYSFTLPVDGGTNRYLLQTNGSGTTSWVPIRTSATDSLNASLTASVGSSALTIALKGADGNDASATNPVTIVFRNSTAATGSLVERVVTSALSTTVSSGSTLGHTDGNVHYIYVYALDNSGTVELAYSSRLFDDHSLHTTTAEGGAGAADQPGTLYSTTARSSVPIKLLGRLKTTQTTAGTWASVPSEIAAATVQIAAATPWQEFPMVVLADASNPSFATNADLNKAYWRQVGWDTVEIRFEYRHGASPSGSANGSGTYMFQLPLGFSVDTNKITEDGASWQHTVGTCMVQDGGSYSGVGSAIWLLEGSTSGVALNSIGNTSGSITGQIVTSGGTDNGRLGNGNVRLTFHAMVPVT